MHQHKPWFTAQFHPEAWGGPTDTEFLFDAFIDMMAEKKSVDLLTSYQQGLSTPIKHAGKVDVKKILLLGSGGLSIGQAGEFDYSGNREQSPAIRLRHLLLCVSFSALMATRGCFCSEAIKALKEEGCQVILMNPNIASVQTNPAAGSHADSQGGSKSRGTKETMQPCPVYLHVGSL